MSQQIAPLKVGLDLDGVLLYNPARVIRPIVKTVKRKLFGVRKTKFYIPNSKLGTWLWILVHKSSMFIAPGFEIIDTLVRNHRITAHIITARFPCLRDDTQSWISKLNKSNCIQSWQLNEKHQQPHLYKAHVVKKLDLDVFIEDNWDIVHHLDQQKKAGKINTHVLWISNVLDRDVRYRYKHKDLASALKSLAKYTSTRDPKDLA